jgi:hypothetical protein
MTESGLVLRQAVAAPAGLLRAGMSLLRLDAAGLLDALGALPATSSPGCPRCSVASSWCLSA